MKAEEIIGGSVRTLFITIFFKWFNQEEAQRKADVEEHYGPEYHRGDGPTLEDNYR